MESHPVQTACCLSDVLDGIAVSAKTPTSLRKSLAFRTVELSLRFAPRVRTQERVVEQDVLPLKEEIAEVMSFTPLKRGVEQATVPQFLEDTVEVLLAPKETTDCRAGARASTSGRNSRGGRSVPHARLQQWTVDVPVLVPNERVQQRSVEHVPVPLILKETGEAVTVVPSERV